MHAHDRYALALAILEGDRDARKVLADLLEEEGERGLAQWARGGSNQKHRRLEFALMLLPGRVGIELAIVLVQHAFSSKADATIHDGLSVHIFDWLRGEISGVAVVDRCREFIASMPESWGVRLRGARNVGRHNANLKEAVQSLAAAVESAVQADLAEQGDAVTGTPRHWEMMSRQHLRAVLRAGQNQAQPKRRPASPPPLTEVDWQLEMTKSLFNQLLSEGSPWPK
jgi:hypothetical protein